MRWSYFGVYLFIGCTENTKTEQMFDRKIANYILCVLWNAVRKGVWVVWKVAENSFWSKHIQRFFTLFVSKRKVDDPTFYIIGSVINDTVLCQIAAFFNFFFLYWHVVYIQIKTKNYSMRSLDFRNYQMLSMVMEW